jgi:DNA-binding HxlR family transcriptional regulator
MSQAMNANTWSPVEFVLHIIGSKWTVAIVDNLVAGPQRPVQLSKALKSINPKTLTERLRDLEKWGLVDRHSFHEIPPRVEYALTKRGRELLPAIEAIRQLGEDLQKSLGMNAAIELKEQSSEAILA